MRQKRTPSTLHEPMKAVSRTPAEIPRLCVSFFTLPYHPCFLLFVHVWRIETWKWKPKALPVRGPVHTKTIVNANTSTRIFLSPSTRRRSSFT